MAHTRKLPHRVCANCTEDATDAVIHHDRLIGYYCAACASEVVTNLNNEIPIIYTDTKVVDNDRLADALDLKKNRT